MKLLISTSYFVPHVSGLTLTAARLAEGLARLGHQVTVLTNQHLAELAEKETSGQGEGKFAVVRARPDMKIDKGFWSMDFVKKAWQEVKNCEAAVINLPQFEGIWVAAATKIMNKRLVCIYTCEVVSSNKAIGLGLHVANWLSLAVADKIVIYTDDNRENMNLLRGFEPKTVTIFPPVPRLRVDPVMVKKIRDKISAQAKKKGIVVGMAARLAKEKGFEEVMGAVQKIKNATLVVAGPISAVGEEQYKSKILKLASGLPVVWLGQLAYWEMPAFYKCIDVLVVASTDKTEAFGIVQIEAMRQGVPVVASDMPGVRVPVKLSQTGKLVKPGNEKEIRKAILELVKKPAPKASKKFLGMFDQEEVARRYEAVITGAERHF